MIRVIVYTTKYFLLFLEFKFSEMDYSFEKLVLQTFLKIL